MVKKLFLIVSIVHTLFALSFDYDSFEANFIQTIKNRAGKQIEYRGKITAKKPALALWEYTKPVKKSVYIKDDSVIVYEPQLSQAKYLKKRGDISLESILKKAKAEGVNSYVAKDGDTTYHFSVSNDMIERLTYKDSLDNDTEILFFDRKKNISVPTSIFDFKPPEGTDILK